ncbi:restriction endonuclease subunit S [Acinetobacter lwoffii]|uniref:restriction endonuclease subunit S n=1 Tax=Acinetobacter lwoffii TaxID=28090 RepID=UPI002096F4C5|nr:restriction endonuclease subunit S [Acinetobacter lwoffii]MCO8069369.1 restriction endonuclease subunit S [Acinetobacter lwoffii]
MVAPKLRFKEFDGDWKEDTLKNCITSIDSGWSPQCESYPANSNEWGVLKTTSVDWSGFNSSFNKKLPLELTPRNEIEVKPLDILVTRAGPTERVGVISVVPHSVRSKLMISDKLIRLKANEQNNPLFLGISLSSVKCQNQLQSKTSGLAKSQTNISQKILGEVLLKLPSKEEQTKIASFLSAVDEKISQLTKKNQLLSQYKQGMMQKLFSQQLRFKADDGSEFGEWKEKKLSEICLKIKDGTHFSPKTFEVGEYKYLTSKNVKNGYLDFSNLEFVSADDHKKIYSSCDVKFGDVLLTKDGTIGQCCVNTLTEEFSLLSSVAFLRLKSEFNNYFLYHILLSDLGQKEINGVIAGQALKRITLTKINDFKFMFPCLEEQTKIANFLSAIDQKIDVVVQQIEQAKTWKKGLLQQMFV